MRPQILDHLPDGLLGTAATDLYTLIPGPTLIHLPGQNPTPLVVSVLQHGNEHSGWEAVRRLLRGRYARDPLPRSLVIFFGNPQAARLDCRHLQDQPDINRCWPGSTLPINPWHHLLAEITQHIKALKPFACIDIHNNTGRNPHYAAVNHIGPQPLQLASEFSKTVIYFKEPKGVQSDAFGQFAPSVTLECGLSADPSGADHAMAYLERCLNMERLPCEFPRADKLELYQMFATLKMAPDATFAIDTAIERDETGIDLILTSGIDQYNFSELPVGFVLGKKASDHMSPLFAEGHDGHPMTESCLETQDGQILTKRIVMPAMLTLDSFAIRHDCLCYLMERLNIDALSAGIVHEHSHTELPEALDQ